MAGGVYIKCDRCGAEADLEMRSSSDRQAAYAKACELGWVRYAETDYCPNCAAGRLYPTPCRFDPSRTIKRSDKGKTVADCAARFPFPPGFA